MTTTIFKCYLELPDLNFETRRINLDSDIIDTNGIFKEVHQKIGNVFPTLKGKVFTLFWKDHDEDFITVSTDDELRDAISNKENGICKIYLRVEDTTFETSPHDEDITAHDKEDNDIPSSKKGNHQRSDPWQNFPPPPPLLPNFGYHHHHHPPPPNQWPLHDMDVFGRHRCGRRGGMGGGVGWRFRKEPFGFADPRRGFPYYHGFHLAGQQKRHKGKHGRREEKNWKNALRERVPMPHRRWAKRFIQKWRSENLKNATSTSDSDFDLDEKLTMGAAGVPQAYADWLEIKLVRWHKRWCLEDINGSNNKAIYKKIGLKESVPKEFRRWTKWYLNSHFRKREAPKFRRESSYGEQKDFMKKECLEDKVPRAYRSWTKQFIKTWRIENKLDPKLTGPVPSSGSEDINEEADKDVGCFPSIPTEYKQWLETFLPCWHTWRGQMERNTDQPIRGGMGRFKESVPMDFRAWVKYFLSRHYSKNGEKLDSNSDFDSLNADYQKILLAFKKQWLQEHKHLDEEEKSAEEMDGSGESESSPNPLCPSTSTTDKTKGKMKVHFNEAQESVTGNKGKSKLSDSEEAMLDSDEEWEDLTHQFKNKRMSQEFCLWAKKALSTWNGESIFEESAEEMEQENKDTDKDFLVAPNVYHWMSKMMMKMQIKKMKQQVKAAKKDMKIAKKLQKASD